MMNSKISSAPPPTNGHETGGADSTAGTGEYKTDIAGINENGAGYGKDVDQQRVSAIAAKVFSDSDGLSAEIRAVMTQHNGYNANASEENKAELDAVLLNGQILNAIVPPDKFASEAEAAEFWGDAKQAAVENRIGDLRELIAEKGGNTYGLSDGELREVFGIDEHHTLHEYGNSGDAVSAALIGDAHKTKLLSVAADGLQAFDGYGNNTSKFKQKTDFDGARSGYEATQTTVELLQLSSRTAQ
jgi:hypothetical protein